MCVAAPRWTALHGTAGARYLMRARTRVLPLGDDGVHPRGRFAFAKYIRGNSAQRSVFYGRKSVSAALVGSGGGGCWWAERVSLTDGLDGLLSRAALICHKELLTKPPALKGNVYNRDLCSCPHVWD